MNYINRYLQESALILEQLDKMAIERVVDSLIQLKTAGGRLFFLGVGGNAANCSHAVNDFRKIANIEAYTPVDNVAELTARTNDEGWPAVFKEWLVTSRLNPNDMLFILSVGGGSLEKNISANLVHAMRYAKKAGAKIVGIVGRDGGYTAQTADACIIIPTLCDETITPHVEAFQGLLCHLLVTHPGLKENGNTRTTQH